MSLTASELTKWAKEHLNIMGYRLNRVNNIPVRRRKGTIEKGWSDLQGYDTEGIYVAIEVKTINDKLSPEQIERLNDIRKCKGIAMICSEKDNKPILEMWKETKS
jgi:hypothetical protein